MSTLGLEKRSIGNARVVLRRILNPFAYEKDQGILETYIHEELQLPWAGPFIDIYGCSTRPFQSWMEGELNLWIGREVIGPLETYRGEEFAVCDIQQGVVYAGNLSHANIRDWQLLGEALESGKNLAPTRVTAFRLRQDPLGKGQECALEYAPIWEYQFFGSAQPLVDNFFDCH